MVGNDTKSPRFSKNGYKNIILEIKHSFLREGRTSASTVRALNKMDYLPQIKDTRTQLKAQQLLVDSHEDPDSRMDMDRERLRDRNKGGKMKGLRGSGKSGFWQK